MWVFGLVDLEVTMTHVMSRTRGNREMRVYVDDDPENPRDANGMGQMFCFHRRYDLGGKEDVKSRKDYAPENFSGWEEMRAKIVKDHQPVAIFPVYLYDHSGLSLSTAPFSCPWDSGQVGYIFVTRDEVLDRYAVKRITAKIRQQVERALEAAIKEYSLYANGDCYAYEIYEGGELVDSCSGFFTDDIEELFRSAGEPWTQSTPS